MFLFPFFVFICQFGGEHDRAEIIADQGRDGAEILPDQRYGHVILHTQVLSPYCPLIRIICVFSRLSLARRICLLDKYPFTFAFRIFTSSLKPTSFSDILPPKSIHPPKLVGAKTFEDLLKRPKLINSIEGTSSNTKQEIEKRKKLIKEALERIKKNREKLERKKKTMFPNRVNIITEGDETINFQPVLPELPTSSGDR